MSVPVQSAIVAASSCGLATGGSSAKVIMFAIGTCAIMGYWYGKKIDKRRVSALNTELEIIQEIDFYKRKNNLLRKYISALKITLENLLRKRAKIYSHKKNFNEEIKQLNRDVYKKRQWAKIEMRDLDREFSRLGRLITAATDPTKKVPKSKLVELLETRTWMIKTKQQLHKIIAD